MIAAAPPVMAPIMITTKGKENPRPLKCPLPCAVCGDQSSGFHYDVPSCNGCKTFFRRTVLDRRVFKCWKGGNCMLQKGYRCTCRACRFKKCVDAGMNPRAIQAPPKDTTKPFPQISELLPGPFMTPEGTPSPVSVTCGTTVNLVQIFLTLERDIEALRANTFTPPTILLDEFTRPSALATVPKGEGIMASSLVHMDIETFVILEYAKAMNWFTQLRFTDKFTILAERTCPLLALRLSWYRSGSAFKDHLSNMLSPLVDAIRQLNMDKVSLSLMSVLLLSESCNLSLTPEATEELSRQKDAYASCLAGYLLQKHGVASVSQVGRHFTLLWTALHVAKKLKNYLQDTLPADCFSRQIIDTA